MARKPYAYLLPMPLAPLLTCPALITAPGTVYRAVTCLAFSYWLSGCRPLPRDPQAIATLIRLPLAHFSPMKSAINAALAELLPELDRAHEYESERKLARVQMAKNAVAARNRNRRAAEQSANHLPEPQSPARVQPVKTTRYTGNGRTDMHARAEATDRQNPPETVSNAPNVAGHRPLNIERKYQPLPRAPGDGRLSEATSAGRK